MFTFKDNPNIFYIGRAKDFQKRFKSHININLKDRFHVFANSIGWDRFEFSVIETCNHPSERCKKKEKILFYKNTYLY